MKFVLPWESPPVRQNDRGHWAVKARGMKTVRQAVGLLAKGTHPARTPVEVVLVWHVTDRRRRDTDGPAPTLKAAIDGLVDAGVLPDDHAGIVPRSWCEIVVGERRGLELVVRAVS